MNKKIAFSLASIGSALFVIAAGAYALFVVQANSTGNVFSTGTAPLQIASDNNGTPGTFGSSIPGFLGNVIAPGYSDNFVFYLKNNSNSGIGFNNTMQFTKISDTGLGSQLLIGLQCVDNSSNTSIIAINPQAATGFSSATAIGTLTPGQIAKCTMPISLPSSADNTQSNQSFTFDAIFNGSQSSSQSPTPTPTSVPSPTATPTPVPTGTPIPTPTAIPTPVTGKTAVISVNPSGQTVTAGSSFTESIIVDGGGQVFNTAQATVTVSNLIVTNVSAGDCNLTSIPAPTISNPSFSGAILGSSSTHCTAYTLTVQAGSAGPAAITLSNGSVNAFSDASQIFKNFVQGSFTVQ